MGPASKSTCSGGYGSTKFGGDCGELGEGGAGGGGGGQLCLCLSFGGSHGRHWAGVDPPRGRARWRTEEAGGGEGFAHHSASGPKTALLGHHRECRAGATPLPMALYVLPLSPKGHPTTAQGSLGVVGGHPEIVMLQPTHTSPENGQVLTSRAP